jgi:hypothetical protein
MIIHLEDADLSSVIDGAGPIAGFFMLLLAVSVFFIWKSMNRQIKRISPDLPMGVDDRLQRADVRMTQEALDTGAAADKEQVEDEHPPAG